MVIYGDVLFLLNLLLDYALLLTTAKITGTPFVRLRLMLAAVVGATYALCIFLPGLEFLGTIPLRLLVGAIMVLAAFGARSVRLLLIFFAVSAALGGGVLALTNAGSATVYRGFAATGADLLAVLLVGSGGLAVLGILFRRWGSGRTYAHVDVVLNGRTASFRALVDTGNTLTDRCNNRVIVVDWRVLGELVPGFGEKDAKLPGMAFSALTKKLGVGKVLLLSYRTVGLSDGLMLAVRPDLVVVDKRPQAGLLLAASAHPVSESGAYQGLIGPEEQGGML